MRLYEIIVQVPLRKTNLNGGVGTRGIPPVPDNQTRFTGIGSTINPIGRLNNTAYPQQHHLMTTLTRNNGSEGFTTTAKPSKSYKIFNSHNFDNKLTFDKGILHKT